jgi:hypothetical protein
MTTGFGRLLHEGFTATLRDRQGLLMFALPAALLLALAWTVMDRIEINATAVSVTVELGLAYIAYFWQRRYLVGPDLKVLQGEERREHQREINKMAGRFVGRAAVYYITLTILALIISFPIFMPFLQEDDPQTVFVFVVIVLGVIALLMILSARFLLAFPACAAGIRMGWGEAWRLGRGHGLRLGVVVVLFGLPMAVYAVGWVLLLPEAFQASLAGQGLFNAGIAVLRIGGMFMGLTSAAYLYRQLTARVDAEVFS